MDANGSCCRLATDRLPNEALVALMVAAIDRGMPPCAQVLEEATSVFTAFFRGQALAARIHEAELAPLVAEALTALHRHSATFDRNAPFRAWLLASAVGRTVVGFALSQGPAYRGVTSANTTAKSCCESVHCATGSQPPACNRTRRSRVAYLILFSVWIVSPAHMRNMRPQTS